MHSSDQAQDHLLRAYQDDEDQFFKVNDILNIQEV